MELAATPMILPKMRADKYAVPMQSTLFRQRQLRASIDEDIFETTSFPAEFDCGPDRGSDSFKRASPNSHWPKAHWHSSAVCVTCVSQILSEHITDAACSNIRVILVQIFLCMLICFEGIANSYNNRGDARIGALGQNFPKLVVTVK